MKQFFFIALMLLSSAAFCEKQLLNNRGFEARTWRNNEPLHWWDDSGWASLKLSNELVSDNPHSGKKALKLTCTEYKGGRVQFVQGVKLKKGHMYELSAWMYGDCQVPVTLALRQSPAPYKMYAEREFQIGNEWNRYSFQAVVNTDVDGARFMIMYAGNGTVYIDDVSVREIEKQENVYDNKGNIFENSSFELGWNGWEVLPREVWPKDFAEINGQTLRPVTDAATSVHGKKSLRFDIPPLCSINLNSQFYKLNTGRKHTFSIYMKSSTPGRKVNLTFGSGYFLQGLTLKKQISISKEWKRYDFSVDLPLATDDSYFVSLLTGGEGSVWFDAAQLEEGEKATPFKTAKPVEARITSTQPNGIAKMGKPAEMKLLLANWSDRSLTVSGKIMAEDLYGKKKEVKTVSRTLSPNTVQEENFSIEGPGFWRVFAKGNFSEAEALVNFVPEPVTPEKDSPFGNHFALTDEMLSLANNLGFRWVRLHPPAITRWNIVEAEKGKWRWYDEEVTRTRKAGIQILGLLYATPSWASTAPANLLKDWGAPGFPSYPAKNIADWENYVRTIVTRYKDSIRHWEVWNEADGGFFHAAPGSTKAKDYAQLLKTAYKIIKEIDPGIQVVGGSGCHMPPSYWLDQIFKEGAYHYCDIISFHMYGNIENFFQYADDVRSVMRKYGKEKPFWHSEYGIGYVKTNYRNMNEISPSASVEPLDAVSEVVKSFVYNLQAGFDKFFYYMLSYSKQSDRRECATFMEWDGVTRPSAGAAAFCISLLENKKASGKINAGKGIRAYGFKGKLNDVVVFWNDSKKTIPVTFALNASGAKVFEMDGSSVPVHSGKNIAVESSPYPRYLVLSAGILEK